MSISVYGRINTKCLNNQIVIEDIDKYFINVNESKIEYVERGLSVEGLIGDVVTLQYINDVKGPYNSYYSSIINEEFEYCQLLIFDIEKEEATKDIFERIVDYLIHLGSIIDSEILVTSEVHDEICLIKKDEIRVSDVVQKAKEILEK